MALVDTNTLLWWAADPQRLSSVAAREISRARTIYISPVSCWEIATLVRRGRIVLDSSPQDWIGDVLAREGVDVAALTPSAAAIAGSLPSAFPGDPADRLLYATARELVVPFLSKDRAMRAFARSERDVKVVW